MGISFCFIMFHDNNPLSEIKFRSTTLDSWPGKEAEKRLALDFQLRGPPRLISHSSFDPERCARDENCFIRSSLKSDYKRQWLNQTLVEKLLQDFSCSEKVRKLESTKQKARTHNQQERLQPPNHPRHRINSKRSRNLIELKLLEKLIALCLAQWALRAFVSERECLHSRDVSPN